MNEQISCIRETSRNLLKLNRRSHRDEDSDHRRCLPSSKLSSENTINDVANKLKTKSAVTAAELCSLKNSLLDNVKHVEVFLNIHGALRGLVRELSGIEVTRKIAAAACCCNLALDDSAGLVLAKHAGLYLVAALDNMTTELSVTSAWALGNLASSPKVCAVLAAQGAVSKLIELLSHSNAEVQDAALYAMVHFAYHLQNELRHEHLTKVLKALTNMELSTASQLLFMLSCHREFRSVEDNFLRKILTHISASLPNLAAGTQNEHYSTITYLIRYLANTKVDVDFYTVTVDFFCQMNNLNMLLYRNDSVSEALWWLLGNLYNFNSNHILFSLIS